MASLGDSQFSQIRGREIAYVSQEPMIALDPCFSVGSALTEPLRVVRGLSGKQAREEALDLLRVVGISHPDAVARSYPHQLSGGMAQRVAIALALTSRPKLLIADEPTTALDVTIQAEILDLVRSLQSEIGMTIVLVTHDLGIIADMCSRVAVMYAAQIVELGTAEEILSAPTHPYTLSLMGAVPAVSRGTRLRTVEGTVPLPTDWPVGCRFASRCPIAVTTCSAAPVPLELEEGRLRRCVREPATARRSIDVGLEAYGAAR
jgi:peptide/nickel transport system permease protein